MLTYVTQLPCILQVNQMISIQIVTEKETNCCVFLYMSLNCHIVSERIYFYLNYPNVSTTCILEDTWREKKQYQFQDIFYFSMKSAIITILISYLNVPFLTSIAIILFYFLIPYF